MTFQKFCNTLTNYFSLIFLSFVVLFPWAKFLLKYFSCATVNHRWKRKESSCLGINIRRGAAPPSGQYGVDVAWRVRGESEHLSLLGRPQAHLQAELPPALLPASWRMQCVGPKECGVFVTVFNFNFLIYKDIFKCIFKILPHNMLITWNPNSTVLRGYLVEGKTWSDYSFPVSYNSVE